MNNENNNYVALNLFTSNLMWKLLNNSKLKSINSFMVLIILNENYCWFIKSNLTILLFKRNLFRFTCILHLNFM